MRSEVAAIAVSLAMVIAVAPGVGAEVTDTLVLTEEGVREGPVETGPAELEDAGPPACGGLAPAQTYCTTGQHVFDDFPLGVGCDTDQPFTGTLEGRLIHSGDDLQFFCTMVGGEAVYSEWYCCFPAFGEEYVHEGYAYTATPYTTRTTDTFQDAEPVLAQVSEGEPAGVPGGLGPWSTYLIED